MSSIKTVNYDRSNLDEFEQMEIDAYNQFNVYNHQTAHTDVVKLWLDVDGNGNFNAHEFTDQPGYYIVLR